MNGSERLGSIVIKNKKIIRLVAGTFFFCGVALFASVSSLYVFYHKYIVIQENQIKHDVVSVQKTLNILAIEIEQLQSNTIKDLPELLKTYKKTVNLMNLVQQNQTNSVFLIDHNQKIIEISDKQQHSLSDEEVQHISHLSEPWGLYQKDTQLFLLRKIVGNSQIRFLVFSIKPIFATFIKKKDFDESNTRLIEKYEIKLPVDFFSFIQSSHSKAPIYTMAYLFSIFSGILFFLVTLLMRKSKKKILDLESETKNQNKELDRVYKDKFLLKESLDKHRKSLLINHIQLLQTSKILCEINSDDVKFPEIQKMKEHTIYDAINNETGTIREVIEENKRLFINDIEENKIRVVVEYDNKKPSLIESNNTIIQSIIFVIMNDHFSKLKERGFLEIYVERKSDRLTLVFMSNGLDYEGNILKELSKQVSCLDFKVKSSTSNGMRCTDLSLPVSKIQLNNISRNKKIKPTDSNVVNLFK